jgi:hypothetical protein
MTPAVFLRNLIEPRDRLLPQHVGPAARCLLVAIAGQESDWSERLPSPLLAEPDGEASGDAPSTAWCFAW